MADRKLVEKIKEKGVIGALQERLGAGRIAEVLPKPVERIKKIRKRGI